jgi:hypothetical protein
VTPWEPAREECRPTVVTHKAEKHFGSWRAGLFLSAVALIAPIMYEWPRVFAWAFVNGRVAESIAVLFALAPLLIVIRALLAFVPTITLGSRHGNVLMLQGRGRHYETHLMSLFHMLPYLGRSREARLTGNRRVVIVGRCRDLIALCEALVIRDPDAVITSHVPPALARYSRAWGFVDHRCSTSGRFMNVIRGVLAGPTIYITTRFTSMSAPFYPWTPYVSLECSAASIVQRKNEIEQNALDQ